MRLGVQVHAVVAVAQVVHAEAQVAAQPRVHSGAVRKPVVVALRSVSVAKRTSNRHRSSVA